MSPGGPPTGGHDDNRGNHGGRSLRSVVHAYRGGVPDLKALLRRVAGLAAPVQLARADRLYSPEHLSHAARLAARAFEEGRGTARALPAEVIRYAAGERQIGRAVEKLGLPEGEDLPIAAVGLGEGAEEALEGLAREMGWREDPDAWGGDSALDGLGVTLEERNVVPREKWGLLALEKTALVDIMR